MRLRRARPRPRPGRARAARRGRRRNGRRAHPRRRRGPACLSEPPRARRCSGRRPRGLAAQSCEHLGQLLGGGQHVARLRALARPDDLARLEQVHEAPGLGEADAQLALQHRRRAELGRHHELGGGEQQLEVVADVGIDLFALDGGRHVLPVLGAGLPGDVLDDALDLGLGDPRALHADRLGRAHRQEQRVALADQLVGTRLVEDDARVGDARDREREARRHVRLDEARDHVDRGPLRGQHQVDARGAGELRDAHDRVLDVARRHHHEVGELVDHDQQVGVRLELALGARRQHDLVVDDRLVEVVDMTEAE